MPLRFSTKAEMPPNLCMECGEVCRRPKRFCSDAHKELWLAGRGIVIDARGAAQVADERRYRAVTKEAIEWRNKLNVQRAF